MRTIQVANETHDELWKIKLALMTESGKNKSYDDVIGALIELWKEKSK